MNRVIIGHVLDALKMLDDDSVHLCVTSPPYWGLRDNKGAEVVWGDNNCDHEWGAEGIIQMRGNVDAATRTITGSKEYYGEGQAGHTHRTSGQFCGRSGAWRGQLGLEPTPELYVEHLVEIFREVKRVLRKDGTCWLNLGDSYSGSWGNYVAPGSTSAKALDKRRKDRYGTFKPAMADRSGASGLKPKDLCGIPWRVAFALQADGWWLRDDIIWAKGLSGRVCVDYDYSGSAMPGSQTDRPTSAHEYIFLLTKSARYFADMEAIKEPCAKGAAGSLFNEGKTSEHLLGRASDLPRKDNSKRNIRDVWTFPPAQYKDKHFATFPSELPATCIKTSPTKICLECGAGWERVVEKGELVSSGPNKLAHKPRSGTGSDHLHRQDAPPDEYGDLPRSETTTLGFRPTCSCEGETGRAIILDPFGGRGTTAQAALDLGRDFIHIDIGYLELIQKTLGLYCPEVERT